MYTWGFSVETMRERYTTLCSVYQPQRTSKECTYSGALRGLAMEHSDRQKETKTATVCVIKCTFVFLLLRLQESALCVPWAFHASHIICSPCTRTHTQTSVAYSLYTQWLHSGMIVLCVAARVLLIIFVKRRAQVRHTAKQREKDGGRKRQIGSRRMIYTAKQLENTPGHLNVGLWKRRTSESQV